MGLKMVKKKFESEITVKQLKQLINEVDDDLIVVVSCDGCAGRSVGEIIIDDKEIMLSDGY